MHRGKTVILVVVISRPRRPHHVASLLHHLHLRVGRWWAHLMRPINLLLLMLLLYHSLLIVLVHQLHSHVVVWLLKVLLLLCDIRWNMAGQGPRWLALVVN
jgi:hypothetical protein